MKNSKSKTNLLKLIFLFHFLLLGVFSFGCLPNENTKVPPTTTLSETFVTPTITPTQAIKVTPTSKVREPVFEYKFGRLTISTDQMVLEFKDGAIVYVEDAKTGEVLVNTSVSDQCSLGDKFSAGSISMDTKSVAHVRCPGEYVDISYEIINSYEVRLTYAGLPDEKDSRLQYDISVDQQLGEIIFNSVAIESGALLTPDSINLTIMNMTTPSIILANGMRYQRADNAVETQTIGNGIYAPSMAVVEGKDAVLATWSETTRFAPEYIHLVHTPEHDHLILHTERDAKEEYPKKISSSTWRLGTYSSWLEAARRWREKFEERTGAMPLWENQTEWVRNIHATFDAIIQNYDDAPEKYKELASIAEPKKVLFFLWNGDRIVRFGDHTLMTEIGRPSQKLLRVLEEFGWPLVLYHPYNLIDSKIGVQARMLKLASKGWLPQDYNFNPDYEGTPDNWFQYWDDVSANYYDGLSLYVIHPGSTKFQDYLIKNISGYTSMYHAQGLYLDTLGRDGSLFFTNDKKIIDKQDYVIGEQSSLIKLNQELPHIGIMSEYQSTWTVPYTFYTWEGVETHKKQADSTGLQMNHPLRTALLGSYSWTKDSNVVYDDVLAALLGTLPEISLVGDYGVEDERAQWSQKRAQLFCEEELFNDLPNTWDTDALAYYRSKNGHWFKFKRIGSGYGYIEELPDGSEVVRLSK